MDFTNQNISTKRNISWPNLVSVADGDWGIVDMGQTAGQWGQGGDGGAVQVFCDVVAQEGGGCQDTQEHDYTPQWSSFFPLVNKEYQWEIIFFKNIFPFLT